MIRLGLFVCLIFPFIFASHSLYAINNKQLAEEMTPLIDKMSPHDPAKLTMVLRLADVLFEATVEVDKNTLFDQKNQQMIAQNQRKAVALYESALTGLNGAVAKPSLETQYRIEFQLGRLYVDQGKPALAEQKWRSLVKQNAVKQIQREAALRLAENLEQSNQVADLQSASQYYDLALATCGKPELCSYIEYRQGWVFYRLGKSDEAIQNILRSLAKADSRSLDSSLDEILKDLTLFLAHSRWTAVKAIDLLEKMALRHKRTGLIEMLSANYFSADQRASYDLTLKYLYKKEPRLDYLISILDFSETNGNIEATKTHLLALESALDNQVGFSSSTKKEESEKVLFRLIFQWDEQRKTRPEIFSNLLSRGAVVYAQIFPTGREYQKITDGWLAVETRPENKLSQVQSWRRQQELLGQKKMVLHFYQIELALHQQLKKWNDVIADVDKMLGQSKELQTSRELIYAKARAYYELKKYDSALILFRKLAIPTESKPDSYGIFSQNLALDILAQEKRYEEILIQAKAWLLNDKIKKFALSDKNLEKEMKEMALISNKAAFSKAASTQDLESLRSFKGFCLANQFTPQSCDNALTLAAKLHDQETTIAIFRHQGKKTELADELEFAGFFSESAAEREKLLVKGTSLNKDLLRIALLFELGGKMKERDRILLQLSQNVLRAKTDLESNEERLIFLTLKEAGMLGPNLLKGPWSNDIKLELASALEEKNIGTAETRKWMLKTCRDFGPAWESLHLTNLKELDRAQEKISIVGRHSQENFERKVVSLRTFSEATQCFLKGAERSEVRRTVIGSLARAYGDFALKIKSVPLPEGLDPETLAQAKEKILAMAQPFEELSVSWAAQIRSEISPSSAMVNAGSKQKDSFSYDWGTLVKGLQENPYDEANLKKLKSHFHDQGNNRLSSYFEGRLKSQGVE